MNAEILVLAAQTGPAGDGGVGSFGFFLPLVAMFLLLYALVIRPQQRQQKEHKKMVSEVQKGDQIVTTGGLYGRVTGLSDDVLTVEIAERVRVRVDRGSIRSRTRAAGEEEKKS